MANIRPLNAELRKIATEELNEIESRIPEDIAALRTWIEKQPHLKARTDDLFLVAFLRGCKYSLEKTKSKIDFYYTVQTLTPEIFANRVLDEKNIAICLSGAYVVLPKPLSPGGPRIHFNNFSRFDQKKFTMLDFFRYQNLFRDWQIYNDDNMIISGFHEVLDISKVGISFLAQFDPMVIRKLVIFAERAIPMRMKGVHIINSTKEAATVLNLTRSLMSEKMKQRFLVHKTMEDFHKFVPKEFLPIEYGGTNGCLDEIQAETLKNLKSFEDYFAQEAEFGVNEKLRPGKKFDKESIFGIEGSFRKLEID